MGGVAEDSLDTNESVQDFGDIDWNGTRGGILISKTLHGQSGLHLLGSEEQEGSI